MSRKMILLIELATKIFRAPTRKVISYALPSKAHLSLLTLPLNMSNASK